MPFGKPPAPPWEQLGRRSFAPAPKRWWRRPRSLGEGWPPACDDTYALQASQFYAAPATVRLQGDRRGPFVSLPTAAGSPRVLDDPPLHAGTTAGRRTG